jgi:outer membrane lipoprotein-sorting protein
MSRPVCPSIHFLPQWRTTVKLAGVAALLLCACSKQHGAAGADSPKVPITKEDKLIAQARTALGPEDKLLAVQTLTMTGKVFDEKDHLLGTIQFLFKKPAHQRSEFHSAGQAGVIEGSNGIEGWMLVSDKTGDLKLTITKAAAEMQNVYTAVENLYFYRAAELVRGSEVTSEGPVTYRNYPCWKVSFHYPDSITYVRYFDQATGELRGTILLPAGTEFVEEGKRTVDGIVFPTMLHNYTKDGDLTQTVKFDSLTVNTPIDDRVFEMPSLIALRAASAKAKAAAATATPSQSTANQMFPALPAAAK